MSLGGKVCCVVEWLDGGESEQCENPPTHAAYSPEGRLKNYCTPHFDALVETLRAWDRTNRYPEYITKVKKLNPGLL